jgi:hypothetical protein
LRLLKRHAIFVGIGLRRGQAARFTFAHLARCAAAILRRADADIVRLSRFGAIETTFCALTLAQRALWAAAIFLRAPAHVYGVELGSPKTKVFRPQ